jgi:hypothetical protein
LCRRPQVIIIIEVLVVCKLAFRLGGELKVES